MLISVLLFPILVLIHGVHGDSFGSVNLIPVVYNSALGQRAHASSFYNYKENPHFAYKYYPGNGNDGFVLHSSWWSSGTFNESVYWQLNFTDTPRHIKKFIIRWHGYLSAAEYRVRISFAGLKFLTLYRAKNKTMTWDRIDIFNGSFPQAFYYIRVQMDIPNKCKSVLQCEDHSRQRKLLSMPKERIIYGIREVEIWATGESSGVERVNPSNPAMNFISISCLAISLFYFESF